MKRRGQILGMPVVFFGLFMLVIIVVIVLFVFFFRGDGGFLNNAADFIVEKISGFFQALNPLNLK